MNGHGISVDFTVFSRVEDLFDDRGILSLLIRDETEADVLFDKTDFKASKDVSAKINSIFVSVNKKMFRLILMLQYNEETCPWKDDSFQHNYFGLPRRKDLNDGNKCPS